VPKRRVANLIWRTEPNKKNNEETKKRRKKTEMLRRNGPVVKSVEFSPDAGRESPEAAINIG